MNDSLVIGQGWFELEHRTFVEPNEDIDVDSPDYVEPNDDGGWERDEDPLHRFATRYSAEEGIDEAFKGDVMGWEYRIVEVNPLRDRVISSLQAHYDFVECQEGFAHPAEFPYEFEMKMYELADEVGFDHPFITEPIPDMPRKV